jgi:hypothetical protein
VHVLNVWWEGGFEPWRCAARFGKPLRFGNAGHIGWPSELHAEKRLFG